MPPLSPHTDKRRALIANVPRTLRNARLLRHKRVRALLDRHRGASLLGRLVLQLRELLLWLLVLLLLLLLLLLVLLLLLRDLGAVFGQRLHRPARRHLVLGLHIIQRQDGGLVETAGLGRGQGVFGCVGPRLLLWLLLILLLGRLLVLLRLLLLDSTGLLRHHRLLLLLLLPRVGCAGVTLLRRVLRRPLLLLWLALLRLLLLHGLS